MTEIIAPNSQEELLSSVQDAISDQCPLAVQGAGTKRGWGRSMECDRVLDLSTLTGVTLYEPEELVLSAAAGTPIGEINQLLDEKQQQLAFEPPDLSGFYGEAASAGTLGGVIAANLSGPKRIHAGAARDHVLGFEAVSGRGEIFKSGGRVVKNVTGFDLSKLMAGSFGTLAVLTSITVKVLPKPEKTRTVLIFGLSGESAILALAKALKSPYEVNGAGHLPLAAAARSAVSYVAEAGGPVTCVRIQGPGPSVEARCRALRAELAEFGQTEELHGHNSTELWREVRDVAGLLGDADDCIWRLSVPPASGADVAAQIQAISSGEVSFDWGGGLIWLAQKEASLELATDLRQIVNQSGGHAMLMRASDEARKSIPVFHPQSEYVAGLSKRMKENFDPTAILNPGRMYEGV